MYSRHKSCVHLGEYTTKQFNTSIGLKQGCNLSPNLFNLFIDDINECFNSKCHPATLLKEQINHLLFADDLVLISESPEGLQNCLDNLNVYIEKWKLTINLTKTNTMTISKRKTKTKNIFKLGKTKINSCSSYKYLGTMINENGSYKGNTEILNKKALGAMFSILKAANKYNSGGIKTLLHLFDKAIVPIILYNSEIWGGTLLPNSERSTDYFSENNLTLKLPIPYIYGRAQPTVASHPVYIRDWV